MRAAFKVCLISFTPYNNRFHILNSELNIQSHQTQYSINPTNIPPMKVHASSSSLTIHKDYMSVVMANSQSPVLHVVIFPFMAQGATIPTKVTIVTTPANAPFISSKTNKHPNISLSIIPFPKVQELPHRCENTADVPSMALWTTFIEATKKMKQSFEDVLRHMIL